MNIKFIMKSGRELSIEKAYIPNTESLTNISEPGEIRINNRGTVIVIDKSEIEMVMLENSDEKEE